MTEITTRASRPVLWRIGFRPFFLLAGLWAVAAMTLWFGMLSLGWRFNLTGLTASQWHAHEMIFGFTMAVIAGFLLTAVANWTGTKPLSGSPLVVICVCWCVARIVNLVASSDILLIAMAADLLFSAGLFLAIAVPIVRQRQVRQAGVLVKVLFLASANTLFYLGALGVFEGGVIIGLISAFYLIIALVLTMARRVIPGFIERRLKLPVALPNHLWVDIASPIAFVGFFAAEVFMSTPLLAAGFAAVLLVLHLSRLINWYQYRIWSDPLLWTLYVAYLCVTLGFALNASRLVGWPVSSLLAIHLFAIGGVGLMTCGMMARVSLGHTGRNIAQPPRGLSLVFLFILMSAFTRVLLPLLTMQYYPLWVSLSQWLWMLGFAGFVMLYWPILVSPRIDGRAG